jgi:ribonuclease R
MSEKKRDRQAHATRIAIPGRDAILSFLKEAGRPRALAHIAAALDVSGERRLEALGKRLEAMVRDGQLIVNRRDGYGLVRNMDMVVGRVIGHPDGYGFLVPDDGGTDLYLPAHEMRALLHGDRAVVRVAGYGRQGRREGAVVEVLERAHVRIVGRFFVQGRAGFVSPDNRRINQDVLIAPEDRGGAADGQFVVAEILSQPSRHTQPIGRIVEVLGNHAAPGMASEIAIRACEIPWQWPDEVLRETAVFDAQARPPLRGRADVRNLPFVTIDGEDARDFDDAVYCERRGGGWRLLVAIADVSHYVRPGTALDDAARERGTSVYFPDRVVPMLPEILSNELCSLKPDVDRLAMVCELELSSSGNTRSFRFFEAVIRSAARMTYTETAQIVVDRAAAARRRRDSLLPHLDALHELYGVLHRRRRKHALLEFDSTEHRIEFDEKGHVSAVQPLIRNDAHRLIEEFMLAANVAAAEYLMEHRIPALFRNHESPDPIKLDALRELLRQLGLTLGGGKEPRTRDFARLMEQLEGRPDAHLIRTLLLRSLPLAVYGAENAGHFGLAFEAYTHFTSPIRRYPDLIVHRAIRRLLSGRSEYPYGAGEMQRFGEHCSMTERRADEATRDAVQRLKCAFMEDRVGEEFEGTITGVTGFGLFIELDGVFVEGLAHVTALPNDYYHFDPVRHQLQGERSGRSYRLAGRTKVRITRVDVDEKKIDFELIEEPGREAPKRGGHGRSKTRRRR